jgi:hypothetical protein
MPRCRARTKNGTGALCQRRVKKDGARCPDHRGQPTAPPRITKPRATAQRSQRQPTRAQIQKREIRDRERVKKAAEYCNDVLTQGWEKAVAEHATKYVTEQTWKSLFRSRKRNCKSLAALAKEILAAKEKFHKAIGGIVAWLLSLVGINDTARVFARELSSRIPIPPIDAKAVAVARGVQIAGIVLCVSAGDDLTRCQCFIDLALTETKTRVKKILLAATHDWTSLKEFSPGNRARSSKA